MNYLKVILYVLNLIIWNNLWWILHEFDIFHQIGIGKPSTSGSEIILFIIFLITTFIFIGSSLIFLAVHWNDK